MERILRALVIATTARSANFMNVAYRRTKLKCQFSLRRLTGNHSSSRVVDRASVVRVLFRLKKLDYIFQSHRRLARETGAWVESTAVHCLDLSWVVNGSPSLLGYNPNGCNLPTSYD